jgi:hypothetical protein
MKSKTEPTFVKVLETESLTDLALIRSVLDAQGVRYFLQGENMSFIRHLDPAVLMVSEDDAQQAVDLLKPLDLKYVRLIFPGRRKP